jgi:hypothetical protein
MTRLLAATLSLLCAQGLRADAPWTIERQGDHWVAIQRLPFAITLLLGAQKGDRSINYDTVQVPAGGNQRLKWGPDVAGVAVLAWAIASPRTRVPEASSCEGLALDLDSVREVDIRVAESEVSNSKAAQSAVIAKREAATLRAENWKDWEFHKLEDPYRQRYLDTLDKVDPIKASSERAQDQAVAQHAPGLAATMASMETMQEQESQWAREATLIQPFVDQMTALKTLLEAQRKDGDSLATAGSHFGELAARQLELAITGPGNNRPASATRLCGKPAAVQDFIAVTPAAGATAVSPIVLQIKYENGDTSHAVCYPTTPASTAWLGSIYWPPDARRAAISVRAEGATVDLGTIDAGRENVRAALKTVETSLSNAKKKLKEAKWLSKGGATTSSGVAIQ